MTKTTLIDDGTCWPYHRPSSHERFGRNQGVELVSSDAVESGPRQSPGRPEGDGKSISEIVGELLTRAPEWLRQDLGSKDAPSRSRAEETLAAMIGAALADKPGT